MQSVSSKIWNRVAVSISYDDNNYTTDTSNALANTPQKVIKNNFQWVKKLGFYFKYQGILVNRISCFTTYPTKAILEV